MFERGCWVINTAAQEFWVATDIYRGLPSSSRSWEWPWASEKKSLGPYFILTFNIFLFNFQQNKVVFLGFQRVTWNFTPSGFPWKISLATQGKINYCSHPGQYPSDVHEHSRGSVNPCDRESCGCHNCVIVILYHSIFPTLITPEWDINQKFNPILHRYHWKVVGVSARIQASRDSHH